MLRELVSQARTGASNVSSPRNSTPMELQLEAVTAERDFFRERYAAQIEEMEELKGKVKDSQKMIDKLRGQILDLEVERSRLEALGNKNISSGSTKKNKSNGSASSNTSVTSVTYDEESLEPFVAGDVATPEVDRSGEQANQSVPRDESKNAIDDSTTPCPKTDATSKITEEIDCSTNEEPGHDKPTDNENNASNSDDVDESGDEESDNEDDANQIRANAERMLLWANYQTTRARATPVKESFDADDNEYLADEGNAPRTMSLSAHTTPIRQGNGISENNQVIHSLPASLMRSKSLMDDGSSLGSNSRHHRGSSVGGRGGDGGGRFGNLLHNLRDIIDPPEQSDSEDDGE